MIEAVIGACYLAFGFERTAEAVVEAFEPQVEEALEHPEDSKSALQELLARRGDTVDYTVTDEAGPPHDRTFEVAATVNGDEVGRGCGRSKKDAEQAAARRRPQELESGAAMHLKSLTLKGFKSFPDRTRLEFGPGVSVIVGPNGSGKSNVTDAVLWALGEQSPLAVRGQSMQDVIFGGARGQQARGAAEVELVIDNADGAADLEFSEISISRRLDRTGEGEYRLNGARCRLVDVLEALSDTGLGKEMHSVVSQGRVEAIVTSKPRDRRLLVEEAAGLGKHRKRRRRAQLKLERTQDNLDRALDVEREARSRLRPLKRQAEAAELHERLERQSARRAGSWRATACERAGRRSPQAEAAAATARAARDEVEAELSEVGRAARGSRGSARRTRSEERERLSGRVFAARSAHERVALRRESARATAADARRAHGAAAGARRLARRRAAARRGPDGARIAELEAELAALELERSTEVDRAGRRTRASAWPPRGVSSSVRRPRWSERGPRWPRPTQAREAAREERGARGGRGRGGAPRGGAHRRRAGQRQAVPRRARRRPGGARAAGRRARCRLRLRAGRRRGARRPTAARPSCPT